MRPLLVLIAFLATTTTVGAQPGEESGAPEQIRVEDLPPEIRLGLRVEAIRRNWRVIPDLVLVEDEAQYIEAIARWRFPLCFPVLIDDGSFESREQVARFVRAFEPSRVVRWRTDEALMPIRAKVPRFAEWAMSRAWTLDDDHSTQPELTELWNRLGHTPPGFIVADVDDHAWTAAIALGAFRAQPIVWLDLPETGLKRSDADALAQQLRDAAEATGHDWNRLGDQVESVTLASNLPIGVITSQNPREILATTDYLGRLEGPQLPGPRWAWVGQIDGSARDAAYRAMCAIFLRPTDAWLFDGYPNSGDWAKYDATAAGAALAEQRFETEIHDTPDTSLDHWRAATRSGIDAGLVMVNTKGMRDWFELDPGRARLGDVPTLAKPAAVYFVHSWSANLPSSDSTIAGRFMRNGAYAYCGSVHEPYLHAFLPTPMVAGRLSVGAPWAPALRVTRSEPWRVTTLGDPLMTLGPALQRVEHELPLDDAKDLEPGVRAAAKERDYDRLAELLALFGRDDDLARLATGIMRNDEADLTPRLAEASLMALFRTGRREAFLEAFGVLSPERQENTVLRDALWTIVRPELFVTRDESLLALIRVNIRPDQSPHDAAELASAWSRVYGRPAAIKMLNEIKETITYKPRQREMDTVIKRFRR